MQFAAYRHHERVLEPHDFLRWGYLVQVLPEFLPVAFPVSVHAVMYSLFLYSVVLMQFAILQAQVKDSPLP